MWEGSRRTVTLLFSLDSSADARSYAFSVAVRRLFPIVPYPCSPRVTRHGSQGPPYNRIVHERGRLVVLTNPATIENPKK